MYILKNETELSLKQIGNLFGGKDHTTVMHAIEKIQKNKASDANVEKIINDITNDLKNWFYQHLKDSSFKVFNKLSRLFIHILLT